MLRFLRLAGLTCAAGLAALCSAALADPRSIAYSAAVATPGQALVHLHIEEHWRVSGLHYAKTSEAWLANMAAHKAEILPLFAATYGKENVTRWWSWWRLFFLSCAELWGYENGEEWIVSHYRFVKP